VTRTRWTMLLAPAGFIVVFELARMRVDGPTVDGIRLDGLYGVIALIGGRGIDAVLVLLPMIVGASWGVALAHRFDTASDRPTKRHLVRRAFLGAGTVAVLVLAAGLVRPASTDAILGTDGEPVAGSVAELVEGVSDLLCK
jgi:proline iminopeptidase